MALFGKLLSKLRGTDKLSSADWQEIEQALLQSDLGAANVRSVLDLAKDLKNSEPSEAIRQVLNTWLCQENREINISQSGVTTILVVGVNGTGKTTSTGKLANYLAKKDNIDISRIILGATDTFRAAAVEQLKSWGSKIGATVVFGKNESDPAAVAFDAAKTAHDINAKFLIIDTAGRLHTKTSLMDELAKVNRVIQKVLPINEVLLVIDATTGQNGLTQAQIFKEAVQVSGIILTKFDGSASGGIALAIEKELGIPIKFVGVGEGVNDLIEFDPNTYLSGLFE